MVQAIVGGNWGDEGKGKMTDLLAADADIVVRFQGGANAGHTIINDYGKFALHLLPSGVFRSNVTNVIGQGVALDLGKLFKELDMLTASGVPAPNLLISDRACVVMPYHILQDELEEGRLGTAGFGSTKCGIAPFYSDKYAKIGIQVCELFDRELLEKRLTKTVDVKNKLFETLYPGAPKLDAPAIVESLLGFTERLRPMVGDVAELLSSAVKAGRKVLLEGQLGALKDPDNGIYPFTTSSSPLAGFGTVGAGGIPPYAITDIVTVVKAYSSAVGAGAFVSEIFGDEAKELRDRGGDKGEYGATTGRPRRMGWFDVVATRYGCMLQGTTCMALSLLDVLGYLDEIPVCVAYEVDGVRTDKFPPTPLLDKAKPILETLPGWKCDISGVRRFENLPKAAQDYVRFVEDRTGFPVGMISVGSARDAVIFR
ncbi:MAG TPA: adenylosuccinate synthase [Candidatus Acidoferrum sp.]|nr:adenylosuccinate synthase [Candidatus Acidoferrum sp.]